MEMTHLVFVKYGTNKFMEYNAAFQDIDRNPQTFSFAHVDRPDVNIYVDLDSYNVTFSYDLFTCVYGITDYNKNYDNYHITVTTELGAEIHIYVFEKELAEEKPFRIFI